MNEKQMIFLGMFCGVSKKSNKPFTMAYFYAKEDGEGSVGYKPYTFFLPVGVSFTSEDVLKMFNVQYVYAAGQYVFVSAKVVK